MHSSCLAEQSHKIPAYKKTGTVFPQISATESGTCFNKHFPEERKRETLTPLGEHMSHPHTAGLGMCSTVLSTSSSDREHCSQQLSLNRTAQLQVQIKTRLTHLPMCAEIPSPQSRPQASEPMKPQPTPFIPLGCSGEQFSQSQPHVVTLPGVEQYAVGTLVCNSLPLTSL